MKRTLTALAVTLIAVGMLSAPAEAKKAKCKTEASCKKAFTVEQTTRTHQDKRGNDWEWSNGHGA